MEEIKYYDKAFFNELQDGSYLSAKKVLPIVNQTFHPASVVDIGCGSGYWLKVWKEDLKVDDLLGVEGDYVTEEVFRMEKKYLLTADLKQPLNLNRRFDLVTTMEVAEHIPEDRADVFIQNLVNAGDIVLFSAAIIGQLGTYHINEQMPEYWAEKFLKHDYIPVDFIRPMIWNDAQIAYWYRQNILVFIKRSRLADFPQLEAAAQATDPKFLLRIHPEKYFAYVNEANKLQTIPGFIKYKLYRLKKWLKR
jgi:SAM-dependent methyltransferase